MGQPAGNMLSYNADMASPLGEAFPTPSGTSEETSTDARWEPFVDELFDNFFKIYPTRGTDAGFHDHDVNLENYSREGVQEEILFSRIFLRKLDEFKPDSWPLSDRQDHRLIDLHLRSTLHQLEEIRNWEKDPDLYPSGICQSAFVLIARGFAPVEERLEHLIERERAMPAALEAGKRNLLHPPLVYTETALEQLPGTIDFFRNDVPRVFENVQDSCLLREFSRVNASVVESLIAFQNFLKKELLQQSDGDFRIGVESYKKKLLYDEMIETPLDELLRLGYEDMRRNQRHLSQIVRQINPNKSPQEIIQDLSKDYPEPQDLLSAFRKELTQIQQHILKREILSLPSETLPIVTETPPFLRALTFASMDTPGPFEQNAADAFFNVTLPDKHWPEAEQKSFMGRFNRGTITSTAIHEVLPGHYAQFLWLPYASSKVRKLIGCDSNSEGWAHYCEQMMLDEGYGNESPVLRFGQLQDALLRNARYIVGICLHTGDMTFADAVRFFQNEAYLSSSDAEMETRRGTIEPTYLVYTLGKLEILKLRDDCRSEMGQNFSMRSFHDSFLRQGFPPLPMVRETLMEDQRTFIPPF